MKQTSSSRKSRPRSSGRKPSRGGNQSGGNRVENRVRGNPKQLLDKYKTQARDARQAGDRILAENYYQYADHYQRVINEMRLGCGGVFEEYREPVRRPPAENTNYGDDDNAFDEMDGEQPQEVAPPVLEGTEEASSDQNRGSRSARAARAEAEEQRGRDNRRSSTRGRRRRSQPADGDQATGSVEEAAASAITNTSDGADDEPGIAADSPLAVSADAAEQAPAPKNPRGRPRRREPEEAGEGSTPIQGLDEPSVTPETDAA